MANQQAKSLGQNLFSGVLALLGTRLPAFVGIIFLARISGVRGLGLFTIAASFTALSNLAMSDTSITTSAVKSCNQDVGQCSHYLSLMPAFCGALSLLILIMNVFCGEYFYHNQPLVRDTIILLAISFFLQGITAGYRWYFKAIRCLNYESRLNWIVAGIGLIFSVMFLLWLHDVRGYALGLVLGSAVGFFYVLITVRKLSGQSLMRVKLNWQSVRSIMCESWPYVATTFVIAATWNIGPLILGHWKGMVAVGGYGAVLRLSTLLRSACYVLLGAWFPLLANQFQFNIAGFRRGLALAWLIFTWLGALIMSFLWFNSSWILSWIFGPHFARDGTVLLLMVLAVWFSFFASIMGTALIAQNRVMSILWAAILGLLVQFLACCLLIPEFSAAGASVAAIMTEGFLVFYYGIKFRHLWFTLEHKWMQSGFKSLFALFLAVPIARSIPILIYPWRGFISVFLFVGLSWSLRIMPKNIWHELLSSLRDRGTFVAV